MLAPSSTKHEVIMKKLIDKMAVLHTLQGNIKAHRVMGHKYLTKKRRPR